MRSLLLKSSRCPYLHTGPYLRRGLCGIPRIQQYRNLPTRTTTVTILVQGQDGLIDVSSLHVRCEIRVRPGDGRSPNGMERRHKANMRPSIITNRIFYSPRRTACDGAAASTALLVLFRGPGHSTTQLRSMPCSPWTGEHRVLVVVRIILGSERNWMAVTCVRVVSHPMWGISHNLQLRSEWLGTSLRRFSHVKKKRGLYSQGKLRVSTHASSERRGRGTSHVHIKWTLGGRLALARTVSLEWALDEDFNSHHHPHH